MKLKFTIKKKVKAHRKRLKKLAVQNPDYVKKQTKKDPGIPNLWPFKEQMLERMQRVKERMSEDQVRQRESRRKAVEKQRKLNQQKQNKPDDMSSKPETKEREWHTNDKETTRRKWFMKELKTVLETADVILEVLDARDPLGCRATNLETMILGKYSEKAAKPKRIILVLNKIDLVPPEVVAKWVKHLRREFPTIAFRASTQKQKSGLSHSSVNAAKVTEDDLARHTCLGGSALTGLLKKYSLSMNMKTAIKVGVVGYPNVGKSSIINSLKRSRAVGVGSTPGFTKSVQVVKLDKTIHLLDSPGVLFSAGSETEADLVMRNCIKVEAVQDSVAAVHAIVAKCSTESLLQLYKISQFNNADEFLFNVAHKRGKIKKGGVPDFEAAARCVLRDWVDGKIPYYTLPPAVEDNISEAKIVTDWSKEIDIDKWLEESNNEALKQSDEAEDGDMQLEIENIPISEEVDSEMDDGEDDDNEEEEDDDDEEDATAMEEEKPFVFQIQSKPTKQASPLDQLTPAPKPQFGIESSLQRNKNLKKEQKKQRKAQARSNNAQMTVDMDGDDDDEQEDQDEETVEEEVKQVTTNNKQNNKKKNNKNNNKKTDGDNNFKFQFGNSSAVDLNAPYDFSTDWRE